MTLNGGCLCRQIKYEISGPIGNILHCHCSKCRNWHGSAFRTRISVDSRWFRWIDGQHILGKYESSPGLTKTFCKTCGSNLVSFYENRPEIVGVAAGTLWDDPGRRPEAHIFVGSKAPWYEITDDLPQFEEWPDAYFTSQSGN